MVTENIQPNGDVSPMNWQPYASTHYTLLDEDEGSPNTSDYIQGTDLDDGQLDTFDLESIDSEINIKPNSITQVVAYAYGKISVSGVGTPEVDFYNGSSWYGWYDCGTFTTSWTWQSRTFGSLNLSSTAGFRLRFYVDCTVKAELNQISCVYLQVTFTYRIKTVNGVAWNNISKFMGVNRQDIKLWG